MHIGTTDINGLGVGLQLDQSVGGISNREIFLTQATFDSNGIGINVLDNSYISVAGLWAASSDLHQIYVAPNTTALLVIAGGTIFNGGVYECPDPVSGCNGLTMWSGTVVMNGVEVRQNNGRGVWLGEDTSNFVINGCRFHLNAQALNVSGSQYTFTGNLCVGNKQPNYLNAESALIASNLNC